MIYQTDTIEIINFDQYVDDIDALTIDSTLIGQNLSTVLTFLNTPMPKLKNYVTDRVTIFQMSHVAASGSIADIDISGKLVIAKIGGQYADYGTSYKKTLIQPLEIYCNKGTKTKCSMITGITFINFDKQTDLVDSVGTMVRDGNHYSIMVKTSISDLEYKLNEGSAGNTLHFSGPYDGTGNTYTVTLYPQSFVSSKVTGNSSDAVKVLDALSGNYNTSTPESGNGMFVSDFELVDGISREFYFITNKYVQPEIYSKI